MRTRTQVSGSEMVGKPKLLLAVSVIFLVALSINLELHHSAPTKCIKAHDIDGITRPQIQGLNKTKFVTVSTASSLHVMVQLSKEKSLNSGSKPAVMPSHSCSDELCTQYLKPPELRKFRSCTRRWWNGNENGTCRFTNGTSRYAVALVSFPGSGSTWIRGLLERATGICTGSVYCDSSLRRMGFNGEGVSSSAVLAVKTHESINSFKSAIHLVRCPADAIVSEWNRKQGAKDGGSKHTANAPPGAFGGNKAWGEFVEEWSQRWGRAALRLAKYQETHPLLRVFYEDLRSNTTKQVVQILDFLQVPYSQSLVEQRLESGFENFHRQSGLSFEHFTAQQKANLQTMLSHVLSECSAKGYHSTQHYVQHYLSSCL